MKLIKSLLTLVLIVVLIGAGLYVASNRGLLNNTLLANFDLKNLPMIASSTQDQLNILTQRSGEVSGHMSNVLGAYVKENEEQPPIHEKAFEYGRYLYCQQVVKEYEGK